VVIWNSTTLTGRNSGGDNGNNSNGSGAEENAICWFFCHYFEQISKIGEFLLINKRENAEW
jgi:hypothetical protein